MSRTIRLGAVAYDPKVVTIWEGTRRYFHEEARLAVEVVLCGPGFLGAPDPEVSEPQIK